MKRLYGLRLNNTVFLATLVDLPCIIEAMKTLDYFNFYKSQDAAQMLYVHPTKLDNFDTMLKDELQKVIDEFNAPKDDPEFLDQLYERKITKKKVEKLDNLSEADQQKYWDDLLRFRHGISPISKNIRNIRYKKKP
jgi:TATA-binding protein-associated factor Taf7